MGYILIPQMYWPIWLIMDHFGYGPLGMLLGALVVVAGWFILWKINFGTWKLGKVSHE